MSLFREKWKVSEGKNGGERAEGAGEDTQSLRD